jgi:cytochrome b561
MSQRKPVYHSRAISISLLLVLIFVIINGYISQDKSAKELIVLGMEGLSSISGKNRDIRAFYFFTPTEGLKCLHYKWLQDLFGFTGALDFADSPGLKKPEHDIS